MAYCQPFVYVVPVLVRLRDSNKARLPRHVVRFFLQDVRPDDPASPAPAPIIMHAHSRYDLDLIKPTDLRRLAALRFSLFEIDT